jgi:glutamate transport system permease protein
MRIILLPQAFRVMLPAIISQLVVVLKDTSLVTFVANYDELLSQGKTIQRLLDNPIQTFFVIGLIYVVINYTLGRLAQYIEGRQRRAGRVSAPARTGAPGDAAPVRTGA